MRKLIPTFLVFNFIIMLFVQHAAAQAALADSSSNQPAFNNATKLFYTNLGPQAPLYNGPEYYYYDPTIKGNAYFEEINAFATGAVFYDGIAYSNVQMLYDLYDDKVAILYFNHYSKYSLIKERVKSFDFLDHHFININADTIVNNKAGLKSAYYDEIYNGKMEILVQRYKTIQTNTGGTEGGERYFSPGKDLYLKKNNVYYSIGSQSDLLNVLKDKKKELQQYIKSNGIKFRRDPEDAMVKISTYYDHLTN